ncbi:F-box/kelch-repeat protein [Quillaja saponaria]|uniref:F-box/kelch-repeat protein n=1 Tax=Quillaja saponaria TaxID=32244 RepID=A0AAD7LVJ1_QUISA|nr:F-box/kelch-repeat protein [Quillaja saponaria]
MSERDNGNSRHFSWLMKSCFPNPHDNSTIATTISANKPISQNQNHRESIGTTISSLPDDIVLECLSRVPPSSLSSLSLVCRRWARLTNSPDFSDLRRRLSLLQHSVFAFTAIGSALYTATLDGGVWKVSVFLDNFHSFLTHARLCSIGPRIYIVGRHAMVRYDTWATNVTPRSAMIYPRKKFAAAVVSDRIYVAGGGSKTTAVEEYEPDSDTWRVVSHAPRRRYGCFGASVDGVFYIIGGLKIGASEGNDVSLAANGTETHAVYASSMDLFDAEAGAWLRSRSVPGGGCVVAACAAAGHVYVLASHAVELSFWSFDARRKSSNQGGGGVFGEWCRIKSPPLPAQVTVDSRVRFSCVGMDEKVVLVQVTGTIDDLLMRTGRSIRGLRQGLVLVYNSVTGEWSREADLPEVFRRAACVSVEY